MQEKKNGRSERIRTSDPLVPNEVRYQAALHSDICRASAKPIGNSGASPRCVEGHLAKLI